MLDGLLRDDTHMIQLMSYYRMPGDTEEMVRQVTESVGLDGVEALIYGTEPAERPFRGMTKGVHLNYWPYWMDFYRGDAERLGEIFSGEAEICRFYGGHTPDQWISNIRANIRAALAERPLYLVWHVQECTPEEAWTWHFRYSDKEVLKTAAEVYRACADLIPDGVRVLFENVFWPGLYRMEPENIDFFFHELDDEEHTGLMFDTGHFMNTEPELASEADGAAAVCRMAERLGSLKTLIRGVHMSCSLSTAYRRGFVRKMPEHCTGEMLMKHISSIDQHRPFQTGAAKQILDVFRPEILVHELFDETFSAAADKVRIQRRAAGFDA